MEAEGGASTERQRVPCSDSADRKLLLDAALLQFGFARFRPTVMHLPEVRVTSVGQLTYSSRGVVCCIARYDGMW